MQGIDNYRKELAMSKKKIKIEDKVLVALIQIRKYRNNSAYKYISSKSLSIAEKKLSTCNVLAAELLFQQYKSYIKKCSKKYLGCGLSEFELYSVGFETFLKATEKYKFNKNSTFKTYLTILLKRNIMREADDFSKVIRLSVHRHEDMRKIKLAQEEFTATHKRRPSISELVEITSLSEDYLISNNLAFKEIKSLNEPIKTDEDLADLTCIIPDNKAINPENHIINKDLKQELYKNLERLSKKQKYVIEKRFGLDGSKPLTLDQIAKVLKISKEAVRQNQNKALSELRKSYESNDDEESEFMYLNAC